MKEFTESLRHDYALNDRSFCIDVGGYEGGWAKTMCEKYRCRVDVYEPVSRFTEAIRKNLAGLNKCRVYNYGVAGVSKEVDIHIQNDSSGAFAGSSDVEKCSMISIAHVLRIASVRAVDVLKLNCEGAEYEILDAVLVGRDPISPNCEGALANRFRNLQVQFHTVVPDYQSRYDAIAEGLSKTHKLTWRAPFIWENWSIKK